ncbi:diaminopimelate epimerase [Candidatus Altiarchaeota archaeon]
MKFWKMHGIGNDYIVVDNRGGEIKESELSNLSKNLCRRRFSVGSDGLLLVYPSTKADVRMRMFNPDGSEAEMCGNGIRCLAKYVFENGIVEKENFSIETLAGNKEVWLSLEDGEVAKVEVDMGEPEILDLNQDLEIEGQNFSVNKVSLGNPHAVIFVDEITDELLEKYGPKIESHPSFPNRTNVEFVKVINKNEVELRVWERGAGETLACGTGACAAVVAGKELDLLYEKIVLRLRGGDLEVEIRHGKVFLKGTVEKSFIGEI